MPRNFLNYLNRVYCRWYQINMKKSSNKGMSVIEVIAVLIVLTIVFSVYLLKAAGPNTDSLKVKTIVNHMKLVANKIENQKRHLGSYPLSINAMLDKNEYLKANGNYSFITDENRLRNKWNGPYLQGVKLQKTQFDITIDSLDLKDILKYDINGYIGIIGNNRKRGVYYVIYTNSRKADKEIDRLADRILNLCNNEENAVRIKSSVFREYLPENTLKPCGYRSGNGEINKLYYYIHDEKY